MVLSLDAGADIVSDFGEPGLANFVSPFEIAISEGGHSSRPVHTNAMDVSITAFNLHAESPCHKFSHQGRRVLGQSARPRSLLRRFST
eukprot:scaffold416831_cov11-Prasinocladus_malaysianus.AAC.1